MKEKRGQMDISFGMIFSIILIIAVLAIAFYVIRYFTSLSSCASVGLFYTALTKEVDQSWAATTSKSLFSGNVPGSVEYVCFGNLTQQYVQTDRTFRQEILDHYKFTTHDNVFIYPPGTGSCTPDLGNTFVQHAKVDNFFCAKVVSGKVKVTITKNSFDALSTISPALTG